MDQPSRATLSVAIITFNEEENIRRTLESVKAIADEVIVVDSHSTDRTVEIAKEFGAKVFVEDWKGFAAQKNSALDKCTCDWVLSLDADEEVGAGMAEVLRIVTKPFSVDFENDDAVIFRRQNSFMGRRLRFGGQQEKKIRLFRRGKGRFKAVSVHEVIETEGKPFVAEYYYDTFDDLCIFHHSYPSLTSYIEHMNRYSSLGAEMIAERRGCIGFSVINIVLRPLVTFIYNYFFRLGFLDGKEGLLLHLYHSVYVSWKYAKAWELSRQRSAISRQDSVAR
jgi:glycosyltransferase involved in cell wall biosynthesis